MSTGSRVRHPKAARAKGAVDDSLVAGSVERDHRVCVAAATAKVILRPAKVADALFARRRDEFDWTARSQARAIDLTGEGKHDRESAPVVVDAGAHEALAVASNREIGAARKHGIEMRAQHDGGHILDAIATADDVARLVRVDVRQPAISKATLHPAAAFMFLTRGRRDLRDGDLRPDDGVVTRGQSRMRSRKAAVRGGRVGRRNRSRSGANCHTINSHPSRVRRKW
jgi:hypothetical protein